MKFPITHKKQTASFKIVGLMLTIAPLWLMLAAGDTAAYAQTPDRVECPGSWKLVSTSGPQERFFDSLAYDSARRQVVLFGGSDLASNRMGDTWTWDGTVWIHSADTGPSPRINTTQMDFDTDQKRVVLFGGTGTPGDPFQENGDTWEWNGTTWTQVAATGPPARSAGSLAYDSRRHLSVLYGGGVTFVGTIFHDTWELLGKDDWKQRFPLAGVTPGNRGLFGLAYDSWRARTVLFGGTDANNGSLGDTWEWDGIRWKQVASTGPSNRRDPALAYDSARHRVVEFGGGDNGTFFGDTWEWNGVDWTQVATTGPSPRAGLGFAYDSARGKAVIFGGLTPQGALQQETWEWTGPIYSCTGRIAGDLNCDSRVDNDDLTILKASLNEAACSISDPRDLNHDGQITAEDAQALVGLCTKLGCKTAAADLFLRIRPSATAVHQGDLLTYAFPVWNLGPDVAEGEVLSNLQVPAGTTFDYVRISGTPGLGTCTHPPYGGTGQIICHEGDRMAPNTTWTVRLTVKVTAPAGTVITENAATMADTPDPNLANNTATVSIKVQ